MHWAHICTKLITLKANATGNHYFKMYLTPHMYKTVTLKANGTGNRYFKMYLTPHMYKFITLKANAKKIVTLKCMWHHICTKLLL